MSGERSGEAVQQHLTQVRLSKWLELLARPNVRLVVMVGRWFTVPCRWGAQVWGSRRRVVNAGVAEWW